jgi:hypothetical protein
MINVSSAMGGQFATAAREISELIADLGANPLRTKAEDRRMKDEDHAT